MLSNRATAGIGIAVALVIVIIVYYANKPGVKVVCRATGPCPDVWYDSKGNKITTAQKVCNTDGTIYTPNYGPNECKNPCQVGEMPCWDANALHGVCVKGMTCPCFSDLDCGGAGRGACVKDLDDESKNYCKCTPPWNGASCQQDNCKSAGACGPNGVCSADGVTCKCNVGWATPPNGNPCSVCADDLANNNAWGPPGSCLYRRYAPQQGTGYEGAILPIPTTETSCVDAITTSNATLDGMCKGAFGPTAVWPAAHPEAHYPAANWYCSNENQNNACRGKGYQACTDKNIGDLNTNQINCWVPRGFFAPAGEDYGQYAACNVAQDCTAHLPKGFKEVAK